MTTDDDSSTRSFWGVDKGMWLILAAMIISLFVIWRAAPAREPTPVKKKLMRELGKSPRFLRRKQA